MQFKVTQPAGSAGLISAFDGLLDPKVCTKFVNRLATVWDKSSAGKTLGGVDPRTKSTDDLHFSRFAFDNYGLSWDDEWFEFEMHFANGLVSAVASYKQQYRHLDTWVEVTDTGFQVQRYHKNWGFYRPHVDSFPNSSVTNRVLGAVVYLNDVEVGGETNFPLHDVSVEARVGRISLFPACWTHPHESCVPLSGDKWIISTFILNEGVDERMIEPNKHNHDEYPHTHEECIQCANRESHECMLEDHQH